jgi:hypothetical protein
MTTLTDIAHLLFCGAALLLAIAGLVAARGYAVSEVIRAKTSRAMAKQARRDFEAEVHGALDEIFDDAVEERVAEFLAERAASTTVH